MTNPAGPMDKFVALCAEGARKFGDDPPAIVTFVESEIGQLPDAERRQIEQQLALLANQEVQRSQ